MRYPSTVPASPIVHGTVKNYRVNDGAPERSFGFIAGEDGKDYFFFADTGYVTEVRDGIERPGSIKETRVPEIGDRVIFFAGSTPKGPQAMPWGFEKKP